MVERVPEDDRQLLEFFDNSGLRPGAQLKIKEVAPYRGIITILLDEEEVVLGMDVADKSWYAAKSTAIPCSLCPV